MAERRWKLSIVGQGEAAPETFVPHPLNPKIHTRAQDAVVEGSLEAFGWLQRVLVNEVTGYLLNGHERVELAKERGEALVPYEVVRVPADQEGAVLRVLDPSAALAETHWQKWAQLEAQTVVEQPALRDFFAAEVARAGEKIPPLGAVPDLSRLPGGSPGVAVVETGVARAEGLREQWQTAPGQLWACGAHRVWCGDSTTPAAWELLHDHIGHVQGCCTSPPYAEQRATHYGGVAADHYVQWFRPLAAHLKTVLAADGSFFLNLKEHSADVVRPAYVHALVAALVDDDGWTYIDAFCWPRAGVPGDPTRMGKFKNQWEPVFWFATTPRPRFYPERVRHRSTHAIVDDDWHQTLGQYQGSGTDFLGPKARRGPGWAYPGNLLPAFGTATALGHPAAFPVDLPKFFVEVYSDPEQWWVDPFAGSGSTMMACQSLDRQCWSMERDPRYVAVILDRYAQASGEQPVQISP